MVAGFGTCSVFLLFSILFYIPYERINCPGWCWGFHSVPRSLSFSSFFSLSLALIRADSVVVGFTYLNNK